MITYQKFKEETIPQVEKESEIIQILGKTAEENR